MMWSILRKAQREKQGDELIAEAKKLGVATDGIFEGGVNISDFQVIKVREAALQERVRRAKEARYARFTWIIALVSSIASVISAAAAWAAVLMNR